MRTFHDAKASNETMGTARKYQQIKHTHCTQYPFGTLLQTDQYFTFIFYFIGKCVAHEEIDLRFESKASLKLLNLAKRNTAAVMK